MVRSVAQTLTEETAESDRRRRKYFEAQDAYLREHTISRQASSVAPAESQGASSEAQAQYDLVMGIEREGAAAVAIDPRIREWFEKVAEFSRTQEARAIAPDMPVFEDAQALIEAIRSAPATQAELDALDKAAGDAERELEDWAAKLDAEEEGGGSGR